MPIPLPEKLRPKNLNEFFGQEHLVGKSGIIRKLLKNTDFFPSLIFWGPPGSGKTTLARIIAKNLKREFFEFSAVSTSTKDIQKIIPKSQQKLMSPIVFIDEIHRFNKAQQDKLLPHVERGEIVFIGATTENPSFEIISPLLSRCRVVTLEQLSEKNLLQILKKGLKDLKTSIDKNAQKFLLEAANGDARVMLNVLEIASQLSERSTLVLSDIEEALQRRQLAFDKKGEEYYNVISAFIEDVASPTALVVADAVFRACETIGYPECQENLAAGTVYLATARKDRRAYDAYMAALADVHQHGNLPVPMKIRNAPTKLMKELGYGKGYKQSLPLRGGKYTKESLLPEKIKGKKYFKG
ncbi:MAG: hypothetical protein UV56_C0013G0004 [Candidatus Woesebacteria bacterium GW2011_GWC1_43_10b]|uniref:AAA+ ATPase domain-containing protein n=1 Tax=Candidatus Woesebacteria bacterium GW2011_GWC1_43_10b TaxID=1618585 RepID=A0A0G1C4R3_9BACT|nr:MAG: hypothetical protein UV56_C0013G0004 [Candidatus Woesebacteria bacterium GW2011_GWC1_43_10b]